jgi:glyoxylate reductase
VSVRILSTSRLVGDHLAELGRRFPECAVQAFRSAAWQSALAEAEALVVLISEPLTVEDLEHAPRLRAIGTYSVGVNHLPVVACDARGIRIVNTPGVLADATADLALALLMAVARRLFEGEELVRSGRWQGWAPNQLLGTGLTGKRCGILGSGPTGKAFAKRVWALGMIPEFWDRQGVGGTVDFGPATAPRVALAELLPRAEVLSLHCPLSEETRGLLDRPRLASLPRGALLINTARGGILDETAVIDLLRSGHLGGAGMDVYAGEPWIDPRWTAAPRAVLLPHLGSATVEARNAMAGLLCSGLAEVLSAGR